MMIVIVMLMVEGIKERLFTYYYTSISSSYLARLNTFLRLIVTSRVVDRRRRRVDTNTFAMRGP